MKELKPFVGVGFDNWLRTTKNIWSQWVPDFFDLPDDVKKLLIKEFEQESEAIALKNSGGNGQG
jgi:hypothetical protein